MENFLFAAHSGLRWLVVLAALVALVWMIVGLVQRRTYDQLARRIMLAFSGLLSLQWLLGLVLFVVLGSFELAHRWEHLVTMTIAVGVSHMHNRWKAAPDAVRFRNGLIIVVVVLVLVYIGVARLPQGWAMTTLS